MNLVKKSDNNKKFEIVPASRPCICAEMCPGLYQEERDYLNSYQEAGVDSGSNSLPW